MSEARPVIGKSERGEVRIDVPELLDSRLLVQAQSGAGKSAALRLLCELTHGRVQQIIIDPEGEFATLREGFDYLVAGKGYEVDVDPKTAGLLARKLFDLGVSAVCDISELERPQQIRFVRLFLESLVTHARKAPHHVLVVLDEAHLFAPQQGQAESLDAVASLCSLGRKRGLCAVLATQRLSKLHKDAAAELRNKLLGATGLDVDRQRVGDELGFERTRRQGLSSLKAGQFYAYGPAIAQDVELVQLNLPQTRLAKVGQLSTFTLPDPSEVLKTALASLAELPAAAAEEARTIDELRAEVTRLRREAAAKPKDTVRVQPCNHEEELGLLRAELAAERSERDRITDTFIARRTVLADEVRELIHNLHWAPEGVSVERSPEMGETLQRSSEARHRERSNPRRIDDAPVVPGENH